MAKPGKDKDPKKELAAIKSDYKKLAEANNILNQRLLELYTLYNVSKTLSMSLQLNELFDLIMSLIGRSLNVGRYFLMLSDRESGRLTIRAGHGMAQEELMEGSVERGEGLCGQVAAKGEPVLVQDLSEGPDYFCLPGIPLREGSYLGVPLKDREGSVLGVLSAIKTAPGGFHDPEISLFEAVAEHVAIAIEKALAFQQTQELTSRDELTALYNRRYFFERFEREIYRADRYSRSLSLLMVDIDHFKNFNDTYGHLRGDQALKRLARIMEHNLRKADVVARYGGEEFLILLPEANKRAATVVGEKLREAVAGTDFNEDAPKLGEAGLTITVGVSSYPEDSTDPLELLDYADKALYFGKAQGRNRVCTEVPKAADKGSP